MFQKIILITGFLGSGKTYFINQLLDQSPNGRWGVIVNDFGAQNIDITLLRNISQGIPAYPVSNGCICCSAKDGLNNAFVFFKEQSVENIIIEASGLFNGSDIYNILSQTQQLFVACILDARDILTNRNLSIEAKSQLQSADAIVLSHLDELDALSVAEAQSKAIIYNENAMILNNSQKDIWEYLEAETQHDAEENHHHAHHHEPTLSECELKIPTMADKGSLDYLTYILSHAPFGQILRAKGYIKVGCQYYLLQLTSYDYSATPVAESKEIINLAGNISVFGYNLKVNELQFALSNVK